MKIFSTLLAVAGAFAPVAHSQTQAQEQASIVITGTLLPRTLGSEVAATSVLTRAELERSGARDLIAALNLLGTALVEQQGGPGTAAVVRLRGADSRDTLVLIDGVPLTDVTSGLASLSQLSTDAIERIEVVRGNLSALYGANASGGVIQIFTRRGSATRQAQVAVGFGTQGTRSASASLAGGTQSLHGRITLGAERSSGFSAANPALAPNANPDDDGHRRRHGAVALDFAPAQGQQLGLDLRLSSGRVAYDDASSFAAPGDTHLSHILQRGLTLRGSHRLGERWTLAWHAADSDEVRSDDIVTGFGATSFGNTLHNRVVAIDARGAVLEGWTVSFGAERLAQSTDNTTYVRPDRDTDVLRVGLQHDAAWGSLQANLRRDKTSDFGSATSGLVGATWRFAPQFSAVASVANSFTPPTLDFLYFDCSPFGFACSNPNLRPEKSRNADLALQWSEGSSLVRATAFAARYRDKIANDAAFIPQNLARLKNSGLEVAARTQLGRWAIAGEATLQNMVDADTGVRALRRPKQQVALRAYYDAGDIGAGAALRYVGSRTDVRNVMLASHALVDLNARWRLAPQWSLAASLGNLLARAYQPTAGYNGQPRTLFVSLAWMK
ncbi:MAG: TonB-dependent receptor [Burkholderiaceae bacterium]|nr:TonB-dependent receptor [Burkholderiaceae bacterium]